jgi:L-aspartate oxidase
VIDPRYLIPLDSSELPQRFADVLVIGSGGAGLRAAIEAARHADVLLVTKDELKESNTDRAQGGVAAVFGPEDSVERHVQDTLRVGCGLCEEDAVRAIVEDGPARIRELDGWGAEFDRRGDELSLTREGGHSTRRVVHAHGDATGAEVERSLIETVRAVDNVRLLEHTFVIDLITDGGACLGAVVWSHGRGPALVWARAVVLATGGCGQVYRETTNPPVATGDGFALTWRAGAELRDLEFIQFHPTTLYVAGAARVLISEAARGEGGILVNKQGERFMERYHPDRELAPRDVVSRAILSEMRETGDTNVYLDLTHVPPDRLAARFPHIKELCMLFDIDISEDRIPVCPSAHYMVGGVTTDPDGRTTVDRLFACGEVASTGLHGANRLASNSLLEGLAMGKRSGSVAGRSAAGGPEPAPHRLSVPPARPAMQALDLDDVRSSLRSVMWRHVGVNRDAAGLERALERIRFWSGYVLGHNATEPRGWRVQNMITLARLIAESALAREESRGVHYRTDFPEQRDPPRHSVVRRGG